MHIKFFKRGRGAGKGPVEYTTLETVPAFDAENRRRISGEFVTRIPPPVIMSGDPATTTRLIDSSDNKWKYTSGVIAFADTDAPTEEQQRAVMSEFESSAFAGLDPDQYNILWVRHEHEGNVELHFVAPRLELSTGKALNIAPPGHERLFDALRDAWNWERGWARPDDPARARLVQQGDETLKTDAARLRDGLGPSDDPKRLITEYLEARIDAGMIDDRAGIIAALSEVGMEVTRKGRDYISVRPEPDAKPIRLKGAIYGESFRRSELERPATGKNGGRPQADSGVDRARASKARRRLEEECERRVEYNIGRYTGSVQDYKAAPDVAMDTAVNNGVGSLGRHLIRELGSDAIVIEADSGADNDDKQEQGGDTESDSIAGIVEREEKEVTENPFRRFYDRIGTASIDRLNAIVAAIRSGNEASDVARRNIKQASRQVEWSSSKVERAVERIGAIKMSADNELERFKSDINLVEYAESMGYSVVKSESSRNSNVMRKGDDKIVIATAADGHGIYFSVRDDTDNGSIIDFVQKRQGLNLGQVRRELRPWSPSFVPSPSAPATKKRKPESERPAKPKPSSTNRLQVLAAWSRMRPAAGRHPYLEVVRGLSPATMADPRFAGVIRIDERGNAVFPHYDHDGLSGYELKNMGFTGFAGGGTKAAWFTANANTAPRLVIVESAIDAMSHAQLTGDHAAAYMSVGGSMSPHQKELMRSALAKASSRGAEIVLATDADGPGRSLAAELAAMAPEKAVVRREEPDGGKDWNDQLKASLRASEAAQMPIAHGGEGPQTRTDEIRRQRDGWDDWPGMR